MKRLAETFTGRGEVKGHSFTQVAKNPKAFIYNVKISPTLEVYEVFKRKENTQFDCESYPTSKAFGIWAWSIKSKERAFQKFNELSKQES